MSDTITLKEITLSDTGWHDLKEVFGKDTGITVRSIGGTPISIYVFTETPPDTVNDEYFSSLGIDPIEIGGVTYEISSAKKEEHLYAKSPQGDGKVSIRIYGTIDPKEDISVVSEKVNDLTIQYNAHVNNPFNPHGVTKAQVGLSEIPNATTNDFEETSTHILATAAMVATVREESNNHNNDPNNPHGVTKVQVGLGNVQDYPIATITEALDQSINNRYMTPYMTYQAVQSWLPQAMSLVPQTVVAGVITARPEGWSSTDMDSPTTLVSIATNLSVIIYAGLKVAFADSGKVRLSQPLYTQQEFRMPVDPADGIHYLYANINNAGIITTFGTTIVAPHEGNHRDNHTNDYFSVPECTMYDMQDTPIRRVYIAKLYLENAVIKKALSVPIGVESIIPVSSGPNLGDRLIVANPYIAPVETVAQVKYNGYWAESEWNDQMGVLAHPQPSDPINNIVVQCGVMGFLASGRESGTAHGSNFVSVTSGLPINCIVKRKVW